MMAAATRAETEPSNTEPIHLRQIEIKGLFRQYDHRIQLRQEDRVTIIHGRNGVGKTAVLQKHLRVAFERGDLEKTAMHAALRAWENRHEGFRIFPQ